MCREENTEPNATKFYTPRTGDGRDPTASHASPPPPIPTYRVFGQHRAADLLLPVCRADQAHGPLLRGVPQRQAAKAVAEAHRHTTHTTQRRQTTKRNEARHQYKAATWKKMHQSVSAGRRASRRGRRQQRHLQTGPFPPRPSPVRHRPAAVLVAAKPLPPKATTAPHVQSAASWPSARPGRRASSKSTPSRSACCGSPARPPVHREAHATQPRAQRAQRGEGTNSGCPDQFGAKNNGGRRGG